MRAGATVLKSIFGISVTVMALMAAPSLEASTISFSTSGSVDSHPVAATAVFDFSASSFTVTLTNTTAYPLQYNTQELDGLLFTLAGGGTASLTSVSAAGVLDCSGDVTCTSSASGSSPYGWTAPTSSGVTNLKAGAGSFKPYAIINNNFNNTGQGGLGNDPHNPFLLGPVVFTFSGSFTGVSNVSFLWGTVGAPTTGTCVSGCGGGGGETPPVPEPASMFLLGTGLLGVGAATRRRFAKKQ